MWILWVEMLRLEKERKGKRREGAGAGGLEKYPMKQTSFGDLFVCLFECVEDLGKDGKKKQKVIYKSS